MSRIIFFILYLNFGCQFSIAQDTIFLKHDITKGKQTTPLFFDSVYIKSGNDIIGLESIEDSILVDFDEEKKQFIEPYYLKTKKYFFTIDKSRIEDSLLYLFWIKAEKKYYVFYAPGHFLFNPKMKFYPYKYRKKWKFWKKKFNGFGVGHFAYVSDKLYEVNYIGEIPNELSNKKLTNF